ncbi:MAG: hypothetical protein WAO08_35580 [Hyphomicrobiaceae bacterium]
MTKAELITALRTWPVSLVVFPAFVALQALLGDQEWARKGLLLLAVNWAVMVPLLLLQLYLPIRRR